MKHVKSLRTGEVFCECPRSQWGQKLAEWRADHSRPAPMPAGHMMFRAENYQDYGCAACDAPKSPEDLF